MKPNDVAPSERNFLPRPTEDDIAFRAHKLWCERGCPPGDELVDWLAAERQLLIERGYRQGDDSARVGIFPPEEDIVQDAVADEAPLAVAVQRRVGDRRPGAGRKNGPTALNL